MQPPPGFFAQSAYPSPFGLYAYAPPPPTGHPRTGAPSGGRSWPQGRNTDRLSKRLQQLEGKLASAIKDPAVKAACDKAGIVLAEVRERHGEASPELQTAWTCAECQTPHHNAKKLACRVCHLKRNLGTAEPPSPKGPQGDAGARRKGKPSAPLTLNSGAPALDWLAGLPGNSRFQPLQPAEPEQQVQPSDGADVLIAEMDEEFLQPSDTGGGGRAEALEHFIALLKEEPSCPETIALIAKREAELLPLRPSPPVVGDPTPLPPAAKESAAAKIQKMLANTRTIHSGFLAKQARLTKEKSDEITRLTAELEVLKSDGERTVREFRHQVEYLEKSLATVTPTTTLQPKAAAPTPLHAAPALGRLTSTNMAPLLQRGIDQFLAKDQRVGESNVGLARELLGAFATLVTQGVAEFNGEQNNGPSTVPAVGEGQDAPTLADVAAASLDGL